MSRSLSLPHINILHKNHMQRPNNLPNICKYLPPCVCPGNSRSYTEIKIIENPVFCALFSYVVVYYWPKFCFFKLVYNRNHTKTKKKWPDIQISPIFVFTEFCRQNCGKFFMEIKCCGTLSQGNKLGRERLI